MKRQNKNIQRKVPNWNKKLRVQRETLRTLSGQNPSEVAGGGTVFCTTLGVD